MKNRNNISSVKFGIRDLEFRTLARCSVLLFFALNLATSSYSQVSGGEYYIHGIFNPTLADADKIDVQPQLYDTIVELRTVTYQMIPVRATVPSRVDSIRPARLSVIQPIEKLYKAYAKAGFGLYTTPLGEFYFDQTRNKKNGYGVHLKHLSSNGGLDDVGPSNYSSNSADVFYKHLMKRHALKGGFLYDRQRVSFYGYNPTDSIYEPFANALEDRAKRVYNDIGFYGELRSTHKDTSILAYDIDLEVHQYSAKDQSSETNIKLGVDVQQPFGTELYSGRLVVDNNSYQAVPGDSFPDFKTNNAIIGLQPQVSTEGEQYVVQLGAGIFLDAGNSTTFHFYPKIYAHYRLFDDILIPYVGLEGERQRNSYRTLTGENPWLINAPNVQNSSKLYDFYGGIRGSFSSDLGFDVRVSSAKYKDMPLFVNDGYFSLGERFAVVYDRVGVFNIGGKVHYEKGDQLSLTASADIFTYTTEDQDEAWNLPPYEIGFRMNYNVWNKLILKCETSFIGKRPAYGTVNQSVDPAAGTSFERDLKGYFDLYLGAEYRYTKRFSIFFDVSNLSASKYERWARYPVQRTLMMGGATYQF